MADVAALVEEARDLLVRANAELDASGVSSSEAMALLRQYTAAKKCASYGETVLARVIDDAKAVAGVTGQSTGAAKRAAETGTRLTKARKTARKLAAGEISPEQAAAIAEAADASPGCEQSLLDLAGQMTLGRLQDEVRDIVTHALGNDDEERHDRQRAMRTLTRWTDSEGMGCGSWRLAPEDAARVNAMLDAETDAVFRAAYKNGRREGRDAYAADALVNLVTGEKTSRGTGAAMVFAFTEWSALLAGDATPEQLSGIAGFGRVPTSVIQRLLDDGAFLVGVMRHGTEVSAVKRFGRYRPVDLQAALTARALLRDGDVVCSVGGCDRRDIEWDHDHDVGLGGMTSFENLQPLCREHHDDKTRATWGARGPRASRAGP